MKNKKLTKKIGARILSEANDLKRTVSTMAKEVQLDQEKMKLIINGECELEESYDLIRKMGKKYSIDISDLFLIESDCENSVKIMRSAETIDSGRIYSRLNQHQIKSPYYEYRDTAMSVVSPFKPEWIKQLRIVEDADPLNPDVIYNNGHFLHQTTFFVGPVNFYYEINGEKFCKKMNTGDSNYITPYWPHSFTSRDRSQDAFIVAITFGSDVRRAQKELYEIGSKSKNYVLDIRNNNKAIINLIKQHMMNEHMHINHLRKIAYDKAISIDLDQIMSGDKDILEDDLKKLALLLNVELTDLLISVYKPDEEVVIYKTQEKNKYFFPDSDKPTYKIETLARAVKMPLMKSFSFDIITTKINKNLNSSLHTYIYNYGEHDVLISWEVDGKDYNDTIKKNDSLYMQPFVKHGFSCKNGDGKLFIVRVSGSVNITTQKEMSYFANIDRFFNETKCWFN
tara:strand:+ start:231 stop:1592 length:1362 start_codon:yes stop_codon:yes gene_type:complete